MISEVTVDTCKTMCCENQANAGHAWCMQCHDAFKLKLKQQKHQKQQKQQNMQQKPCRCVVRGCARVGYGNGVPVCIEHYMEKHNRHPSTRDPSKGRKWGFKFPGCKPKKSPIMVRECNPLPQVVVPDTDHGKIARMLMRGMSRIIKSGMYETTPVVPYVEELISVSSVKAMTRPANGWDTHKVYPH
jgi:hypothetical protein